MMKNLSFACSFFAALLLAAATPMVAAQTPVKTSDGRLTNAAGLSLYVYDKDAANSATSACNGPCAANWPPLLAQESDQASGDYRIITRDDGSRQWTFKGKPLYQWSKDQKPGDKNGDGFNDVWHLAR
jgi:predicted lipoprotein with Yx(FWY)xxD motif